MAVKHGEIYWVAFDPIKGHEQGGVRPALIVQHDLGSEHSETTVVAAITRTLPPRAKGWQHSCRIAHEYTRSAIEQIVAPKIWQHSCRMPDDGPRVHTGRNS